MKKVLALIFTFNLALLIGACGNSSGNTGSSQSGSTADAASESPADVDVAEETEVTKEEKVLNLDGLWKIDRIEGIEDEKAREDAVRSISADSYAVIGDHVYVYVEDKGIAKRESIVLEEMNSQESPVDIGYCNKYKIGSGDASFFSEDQWVVPVIQTDGKSASFVYKKKQLTRSGQRYIEEAKKATFSEPTKDYSFNEVSFRAPASWKTVENSRNWDSGRIFVPTGVPADYQVTIIIAQEIVERETSSWHKDKPDSDINESLLLAAKNIYKNEVYTDVTEPELTTINGYLCSKVEAKTTYGQICEAYCIRVSDDRGIVFMTVRKEEIEKDEQNENAIIYSLIRDNVQEHQLIQTCDQDPNRDVILSFKNAKRGEGNDGIPVFYSLSDFYPRVFYKRAESTDPINIRIECILNGAVNVANTYSIGLGEVLSCDSDTLTITNENQGLWVFRVVNDDTDEVLTESIINTKYTTQEEIDNANRPEIGMTAEEVEASSWGKPDRKNITEAYYGTHEQWVYEGKGYVYLDDGIVTSIQWTED